MAKVRVHVLAKELNIKSTDVLNALKSTKYEVSNVQSAIGEEAQQIVRAKFANEKAQSGQEKKGNGGGSGGIIGVSKAQQAARPRNIISISGAKKPRPEKSAEERTDTNSENVRETESDGSSRDGWGKKRRRGEAQESKGTGSNGGTEQSRKKSGISTLYNAEYSTNTRRSSRDRNNRRENPRQEQHSIIRPRPVGERAMRPISERTANNEESEEKLTVAQEARAEEKANAVTPVSAVQEPENKPQSQAAETHTQSQAPDTQNSQAPDTQALSQETVMKAEANTAQEPVKAEPEPSQSAATQTVEPKEMGKKDAPAETPETGSAADSKPHNQTAGSDNNGDKPADVQPGEQILQSGSRILGNIFADGNYTMQDTKDSSGRNNRSRRNKNDRDKRSDGKGENRGDSNRSNRDERGDGSRTNRDGSNRDGARGNRDNRGDNRGDGSRTNRDGSNRDGARGNRDNRGDNRGDGSRMNRDGSNRDGARGNRDNRGDNRGDGSRMNRDGSNRDGARGNRDNRGDNRGDGSRMNRDGRNDFRDGARGNRDNRGDNRGDGNRRNDRGQGGDFRNDRSQGGDFRNDRGGSQGADRRGARGGRDRFDREAYDKSGPAEEQVRGKESRERAAVDRKNSNRHQNNQNNHDKLGSKRQENYVNLERHGGRKKPQAAPQQAAKDAEDTIRSITIPEKITIRDLADAMKLQPSVIVKELFLKGQMVTVNSEVSFEEAEEIALEHNVICEQEEKVDVIAEYYKEDEEPEESLVARPPVVCVMGHVDHGKTSLLDAIRSTRVTDREAGGITQHIGASVVSINGQNITFLDTPGHEAFTAMRMRGANSTDIAILVIAADDGVMPQTVEAINHAKAANVEIMVAINKIDKVGANPEKVKQELTEYELVPEEWGGSTVFCEVSAKTGEGIDNLLEMILLTAEVLELKANPNRKARGLVIEAQLDKGRGSVATMLVQKGTLHVGDTIVCGSAYGRIRAMVDDQGRRVKQAGPSMPVEILGLNSVPNAGEAFMVPESEHMAKEIALAYVTEEKNRLIAETRAKMSLDDLFSQIQSGNMKELDLIVKADVQGSVEAVKQSLEKLSNEEIIVKVIHGGVGAINESDVILASASNAIIIGFNVKPDPMAKQTAEREKVDVRLYSVIYNAIDDVEAAMKGMLDPVYEEKILGHAEIRMIFKASNVGNIAGSYVLDGTIERGCMVRVSREGNQIFEGELESLKRFKDDVKEVRSGYECGLVIHGFNDIQELDIVEAYKMVEVPR